MEDEAQGTFELTCINATSVAIFFSLKMAQQGQNM
jgi:hypothetical protein